MADINLPDLVAKIRINDKDLNDATGRVSGALGGVAKVGAAAFAGLAVAAGAFGVKAIGAASDMGESLSKVGTLFGESAKGITDAADQMAASFGTNKQVFIDAAAGIGLVGKASGLSGKEAAVMGTDFAKLAADVSSFQNVPLEDALAAIKSGLVGEAEPLRRFGVLLNEAAVEAEAVRLGLIKAGDTMTEQEKVTARASLITKGFADAQGDLARTAESPANVMRKLQGTFENIVGTIGGALLPVFGTLLKAIEPLVPVLGELLGGVAKALVPVFAALIPPITDLAKALGPVLTTIITAIAPILGELAKAFVKILVALLPLLPPLTQLLLAFLPLIPPLAKIISLMVSHLVPVLVPVINLITKLAGLVVGALTIGLKEAIKFMEPFGEVFKKIGRFIDDVVTAIGKFIDKLKKIKLPDFLTPGSPSPFEVSLANTLKLLKGVGNVMPDAFSASFAPASAGRGAPSNGSGSSRVYNVNVTGTGTINEQSMLNVLRRLELYGG